MTVLNVTTIIDEQIKDEFLEYLQHVHIPLVLSTGKFEKHQLLQLTEPVNEGLTFCVQYFAKSASDLEDFKASFLDKIDSGLSTKFGNRALSFKSVLESLD
mgnify:CR=1 FL=1